MTEFQWIKIFNGKKRQHWHHWLSFG